MRCEAFAILGRRIAMETVSGQVRFGYRFMSEDVPAIRLHLKVEIKLAEGVAS